jgi:hypothetical protein
MPNTGMRRAGAALDLARRHLPRDVESNGRLNDWNVVAPGLIGSCAAMLESIFQLPPPRHQPSAGILARSLVDYVITFAWLAAAEDEYERTQRLTRFEIDHYEESDRADAKYTRVLPERSARYAELIKAGKMPSHLITEEQRAIITNRRAELHVTSGMPNLLDRAVQADERWADDVLALMDNTLAGIYAFGFVDFSNVSHPSASGVARFAVGDAPHLRVGEAQLGRKDATGPYGFSTTIFCLMLVIASRTLGWPPEPEVIEAANVGAMQATAAEPVDRT